MPDLTPHTKQIAILSLVTCFGISSWYGQWALAGTALGGILILIDGRK